MQERDLQDAKQEKAQLRRRILKERNALSQEQRQIWDRQILERLIKYDAENPCSVYLSYVNYKSEVNTKNFILWCLEKGKTVFVPKVKAEGKPAEMEFYRIREWEELKSGYQGILEPEALPERAFSLWFARAEKEMKSEHGRIHLRMLLPGAVFDKKGNRIGYGGGFYDRWLAKWEKEIACFDRKFETTGIAYRLQIAKVLETENFDKRADHVITEDGWIV